jgi:putative inorganic carbon (HCO3(-)) transporter
MIGGIRSSKPVQFALSGLVGLLGGVTVLVDVPLKMKAAGLLAMALVVFLLRVSHPERILLFALAFTVPFFIGKDLEGFLTREGHIGGFSAVGVHLTDVLAVALLLLHLGRPAARRARIRLTPLTTVPALVWLAVSALSLANAMDVGVAAVQLIGMGRLFLLYLAVSNSVGDEEDVGWVVAGLLLGLLSEALLGFYQGIVGRPLGLFFLGEDRVHQQRLDQGLVYRAQGTAGTPNGYAMYLVVTMSFALALLFLRGRRSYQAFAGVVLCAGIPALVFSLSRGGWISFVTVIVVTLVLASRRGRLKVRTLVLIACTACVVLFVISIVASDLIVSRLTSEDHGSAASRVELAEGAWRMIQDHPVLGVGLNNYTLLMPRYDWDSLQSWGRPAVVHNVYLLVTAETGIIGLVAFLWLLASVLSQAWLLVRRAPNDAVWMVGVGILCTCIALAVHNAVDYLLVFSWHIARQFWLLAGVGAGLGRSLGHGAERTRLASPQAVHPVGYGTAVGT